VFTVHEDRTRALYVRCERDVKVVSGNRRFGSNIFLGLYATVDVACPYIWTVFVFRPAAGDVSPCAFGSVDIRLACWLCDARGRSHAVFDENQRQTRSRVHIAYNSMVFYIHLTARLVWLDARTRRARVMVIQWRLLCITQPYRIKLSRESNDFGFGFRLRATRRTNINVYGSRTIYARSDVFIYVISDTPERKYSKRSILFRSVQFVRFRSAWTYLCVLARSRVTCLLTWELGRYAGRRTARVCVCVCVCIVVGTRSEDCPRRLIISNGRRANKLIRAGPSGGLRFPTLYEASINLIIGHDFFFLRYTYCTRVIYGIQTCIDRL